MINTFFTSDHHFGHKNILEYEKEARPFSSLKEMHEVLIERWNNVVKPKDNVFHLGDFCFGRQNIPIASRLNGRKKMILGNHDIYPSSEYLRYFDKLYGVLFWNGCILSHVPVHTSEMGSRWILNIHGHLHNKKIQSDIYPYDDPNYFNVSCEQNNLTPIHADIIRQRLMELEND